MFITAGRSSLPQVLLTKREDQEQEGTRAPHNAGVLVYFSFLVDEKKSHKHLNLLEHKKDRTAEAMYAVGG